MEYVVQNFSQPTKKWLLAKAVINCMHLLYIINGDVSPVVALHPAARQR